MWDVMGHGWSRVFSGGMIICRYTKLHIGIRDPLAGQLVCKMVSCRQKTLRCFRHRGISGESWRKNAWRVCVKDDVFFPL